MSNIALMDNQYSNEKKGFSKDNKYAQAKNREYEELERQLEEQEKANRTPKENPEPVEDKEPVNKEDAVFKKRYSDLRSYASRKEAELLQRIKELETAVSKANTATKYPKTEEEVKEWMEQYPDVAGIIQTIAGTISEEKASDLKAELEALNQERLKVSYERAYNSLITIHPDFPELAQTEDFQVWLQEQPQAIIDTINKPSLDDAGVKAAARTIKLYKVEKEIPEKKSEAPSKREAAKTVSRSVSDTPASEDGTPRFSESQVQKMSSREYEANEKAILAAMKKGPPYFVYDLTGGAR